MKRSVRSWPRPATNCSRFSTARTRWKTCERCLTASPLPPTGEDVNNHIHTTFSFSPYSPTAAVFFARRAGLCTCGLMDHDSIAGAQEFLDAAKVAGMAATIGMECRASFLGHALWPAAHQQPRSGRRGLHDAARRAAQPRRRAQRALRRLSPAPQRAQPQDGRRRQRPDGALRRGSGL